MRYIDTLLYWFDIPFYLLVVIGKILFYWNNLAYLVRLRHLTMIDCGGNNTSTTPSSGSSGPSPFQQLPYWFNQCLQNFSGHLTPIRNSIAPLFSVNPTQAPMALTQPVDSYPNLVQNDLPVSSSIGIDPDQALLHTHQDTQETQQDFHLPNLNGFTWFWLECWWRRYCIFSTLLDNCVDNLP